MAVIKGPGPTPDPDRTQIEVPTSGGGIMEVLSRLFGTVFSVLGNIFSWLLAFSATNGAIVASVILAILGVWLWKKPVVRGIMLVTATVLITLWFVNNS